MMALGFTLGNVIRIAQSLHPSFNEGNALLQGPHPYITPFKIYIQYLLCWQAHLLLGMVLGMIV